METGSVRVLIWHVLISVMVLGLTSIAGTAAEVPQTTGPAAGARIFGHVRDFDGKPIEGADIELKTARFENAAATRSARDGSYSMSVEAGMYIAFAAVKDYQVSKLEYWAWNVPAFGDLEIDPLSLIHI